MKIVILTGAGLSAESGLGTFRDKGGLWTRYDLNEVATPEGFARDPALVHEFYNARRANARDALPNAGHLALAQLQGKTAHQVTIVTQNVDDLHERAGSAGVIHMHGSLFGALCHVCGHRWPASERMAPADPCPACARTATRPDVVWFGEMPVQMDEIEGHLLAADLFAAIGTSGEVWPAAGFVEIAAAAGARTVEINLEPSGGAARFDEVLVGPATRVVADWVRGLGD